MRIFHSVFIMVTLVLTTNASTMYQRALTIAVEKCGADLTTLGTSITTSTKALNNLTIQILESSESSLDVLLKDTDGLTTAIEKASQSCCFPAVYDPNEEDNMFLFNEAVKFVDEVEAFAGVLTKLYKEGIVRSQLFYFNKLTDQVRPDAKILGLCLVTGSAKDKKVETTALTDKLANAFTNQYLSGVTAIDKLYSSRRFT